MSIGTENYIDEIMLQSAIEKKQEWREWGKRVPSISFPSEWRIKLIPPFGGAIARFVAEKGEHSISVYLDAYCNLGYWDGPYWEFYPYEDDVYRCDMDHVEELIEMMHRQFLRMEEQCT